MNEIRFNGIRVLWPARGENQSAEYKDREEGVLTLALTQELADHIQDALDAYPDFSPEADTIYWCIAVIKYLDYLLKKEKSKGSSERDYLPLIRSSSFRTLEAEWEFVLRLVDNKRVNWESEPEGFKAAQVSRSFYGENMNRRPSYKDEVKNLRLVLEKFLLPGNNRYQVIASVLNSTKPYWRADAAILGICLLDVNSFHTRIAFEGLCKILKSKDPEPGVLMLADIDDIASDVMVKDVEQLAAALWPTLLAAAELAAAEWRVAVYDRVRSDLVWAKDGKIYAVEKDRAVEEMEDPENPYW